MEAAAKLTELWAGTAEGHAEIADRKHRFMEADRLRSIAGAYRSLARTLRHEAGTADEITKPMITVKVCSNCGTAFPPLPDP